MTQKRIQKRNLQKIEIKNFRLSMRVSEIEIWSLIWKYEKNLKHFTIKHLVVKSKGTNQ